MAQTSILIKKLEMTGALGLFAQAVVPGAEVFFEADGGNYRAVFPNASPLEGATSFDIPQGGISKQVQQNAVLGHYVLYLENKDTEEKAYLELTVAGEGLSYVGLIAQQSTSTVHTQVKQPSGQPFEVAFTKSVVNEPATISISTPGHVYPAVSLDPEETNQTTSLDPAPASGETVSLELSNELGLRPDESGGTEVVDIIVEP